MGVASLVANSAIVELVGVTKKYVQAGQQTVVALEDVNLQVQRGEFVVVVGHNGSGKSTLLSVVSGDLLPDTGNVRWNGERRKSRVARVRQSPKDGTFPDLTVLENFQIYTLRGRPSVLNSNPSGAAIDNAKKWAKKHGLKNRLDQRVSDLSQGQRQLLALDLAMALSPDILLLDEHTASLDRRNADRCMEVTARIAEESETTVFMVTHNLADALRYGSILVVLRDGRVAEQISGKAKDGLSMLELMQLCGFIGS